jgi:hypothetical protein
MEAAPKGNADATYKLAREMEGVTEYLANLHSKVPIVLL